MEFSSYQAERFSYKCPCAQKSADDETPQDSLDLGDSAMFGVDGIFLNEHGRTTC